MTQLQPGSQPPPAARRQRRRAVHREAGEADAVAERAVADSNPPKRCGKICKIPLEKWDIDDFSMFLVIIYLQLDLFGEKERVVEFPAFLSAV